MLAQEGREHTLAVPELGFGYCRGSHRPIFGRTQYMIRYYMHLPIRHENKSFLVQLRTFDVLGSQRMIFGLHRRLPLHTATSISVAVPAHQHRARLKYHTPHAMVLRCQVGYDGDPRKSRGVPAAESLKRPTSRSFHPRLSAAGRCSPLALS